MASQTIQRILTEREFKDINRRFLILDRLNLVYVATPKVACSTIKRLLYLSEARNRGLTDMENTIISQRGIVHQPRKMPLRVLRSYSAAERERFLSSDDIFRFTFVRNPFARILSGYLDKFVQSRSARPAIEFKEEFGYPADQMPTFAQFARGIATQTPVQRNPHWRNLVNLVQPEIIDYALIGRLENFKSDLALIRARIPESERDDPVESEQLRANHQTRAGQKLLEYYDAETIDLVRESFADDFATFNYSTDFEAAIAGN